ncbi:hypothetical protein [Chondromyces apiculatus]|uniref:Uncharacterized protein n=1 Tax=Chondromyces apiculatus DSM 436 TaxID=1192034 RepID=A0A017SZN3_9BACT|nr:hypothetical protein [Chondromyces apiculatus]EYF02227.1 Hypothetical protein CAP_7299 [Chondromyces apiculatus DSM 436]
MASIVVQPHPGPYVHDFSHLSEFTVDVQEGHTKGLCREKLGWSVANQELATNLPLHAATLGLASGFYGQVEVLNDRLAQVRSALVVVGKLMEALEETEIILEDERETLVNVVVNATRTVSKRKNPAVRVAFEETERYHGQVARRAAKTRRRNAEEAEAAAAEEAAEAAAGDTKAKGAVSATAGGATAADAA